MKIQFPMSTKLMEDTIQFDLTCDCGEKMTFSEGAAGVTRTCRCGRAIEIPSLDELRRIAGTSQPTLPLETTLETLLLAGKLPEESHCVLCGVATTDLISCRADCERAYVESGKQPWWVFVLAFLTLGASGVAVARASANPDREHGKDRIYDLPLRVCSECQSKLVSPQQIRGAMLLSPLYARLLKKYPDSILSLPRS